MKLGLIQEIDWKYIGATLAQTDDEIQAMVIKAFLKECLTWGTHYQIEKQLACVNLKLTSEERDMLSMLSFNDKDV